MLNLQFVKCYIEQRLTNEKEAEAYLIKFYKPKGYDFVHGTTKRSKPFPVPHQECNEYLKDKNGIPDLIFWNNKEIIFIEVKISSGSIQGNQIAWCRRHPEIKTVICFVGTEDELRTGYKPPNPYDEYT